LIFYERTAKKEPIATVISLVQLIVSGICLVNYNGKTYRNGHLFASDNGRSQLSCLRGKVWPPRLADANQYQ